MSGSGRVQVLRMKVARQRGELKSLCQAKVQAACLDGKLGLLTDTTL